MLNITWLGTANLTEQAIQPLQYFPMILGSYSMLHFYYITITLFWFCKHWTAQSHIISLKWANTLNISTRKMQSLRPLGKPYTLYTLLYYSIWMTPINNEQTRKVVLALNEVNITEHTQLLHAEHLSVQTVKVHCHILPLKTPQCMQSNQDLVGVQLQIIEPAHPSPNKWCTALYLSSHLEITLVQNSLCIFLQTKENKKKENATYYSSSLGIGFSVLYHFKTLMKSYTVLRSLD